MMLKRSDARGETVPGAGPLDAPATGGIPGRRAARLRAYAHSPFYRRFHAGLQDKPLHELPVLTKAALMEHFDEIATDPAIALADLRAHVAAGTGQRYLGRYWVCATSGSSGRPTLFLFDRDEWAVLLASLARAHEWAGLKVTMRQRMTMAAIASTAQVNPWHASSQAGATLSSKAMRWWMPTLSLAANQPVPDLVRHLNDWQPQALLGYPSMLRVLAEEQLAGRSRIAPHQVIAGSEVLTDETRRRAEAAWGPVVFNAYGTTETGGGLAAECERHDGDKLLITVLHGRTLPLIRYEIEDRVRMAGSTGACGRPFALIEEILGRTWEALRLPGLVGGEVTVQPLTFTAILDTLPITGWQVIHEADGALTVIERIEHALTAQGARLPSITVTRVESIPKTASGKAPLVRSARPTAKPAG